MQEVIADIMRWRGRGEAVALATVVQTWGSAPRKVGAKMAISAHGEISGSVSGGCVEGAVVEEAMPVLHTGKAKLLHYGIADEMGWEVGLACGGNIQIFVEPLHAEFFDMTKTLAETEGLGAVATVINGPDELVGRKLMVVRGQEAVLGSVRADLDGRIAEVAHSTIARGHDALVSWQEMGIELFIDAQLPSPVLVMVGGVHIAVALADLAKRMGYRTVVVDPRHAFGSDARFPHVDRLIRQWPGDAFAQINLHENMAVAILTHDPKIDDPALQAVLRSPVFYIGALGSSRTHQQRVRRLLGAGFGEAEIARVHAPIGLEIEADTPEEIALAVMAQVVKTRHLVYPLACVNQLDMYSARLR